eukprot:scaffold1941_cov62-Cyclotella_meneghiniana.AAC.1
MGVNYTDQATSKTICRNACSQDNPPPYYVGFETWFNYTNSTFFEVMCNCLFSSTAIPDFNYTAPGFLGWTQNNGCGNIVSTESYQYAKCYRASSNSITCTEQPTTPPSAAPITSSPMTSVATYAPTTDYDFIGDGNCLDGPTFDWSFSYFTNVAFNTGVNYTDDATSKTICSNICNEHTAPPYVGFETDVFYGGEVRCFCLFSSPNVIPNLTYTSPGFDGWTTYEGCGNVGGSDTQNIHCYRASSNPVPCNTAPPSVKPTSSPTASP